MLNRKKTLMIAVLAMSGTAIFAQCKLTSLEDAMNPARLIHIKAPYSSWGEDGMPYEDKNENANAHREYHDQTNSDGTFALDFVNRQRVWRYATRGDYELTNLKTGEKRQLGKGLPEASLMFAKFSPDGTKVAYVSKNNIYIEELRAPSNSPIRGELVDTGASAAKEGSKAVTTNSSPYGGGWEGASPIQLTFDGSETIINGTFDWVYEEEFDCRDGFRWSGDSKYIAFWHSDTEGTGWFDIINNVDSIYPTVNHFPYPKAGTMNSAVKVGFVMTPSSSPQGGGLVDSGVGAPPNLPKGEVLVDTGTSTANSNGQAVTTPLAPIGERGREIGALWIDIPGDQRENYIPRMEFVPGTNKLMIQQLNRAQNTNKVWTCTVSDNSVVGLHLMLEDTDSAWLETNDNIHFLKGNKYFTFTSERDGWRHIYRVSADGKKWSCITKGNMDVVEEVALDEKRGYIYFMGCEPDAATQRYLYRAKIYGNGAIEKIKTQTKVGQYRYDMSPTCDYAVECYSSASQVPQYRMIKCDAKGNWTVDKELEMNTAAQKEWNEMGLNNKEFVKVKSGDLMLDAWIIKPTDFDPNKKYPVIDYVYGEPASATVQDKWERSLFWHYLATQGFVVVSIENRGANSPRGREWRKCIYGEVGVAASEDQAQGILALCDMFPWMDRARLGITGWSGGGAQTLNSMFRYPDVFKTGVAIAFVSDQRLYDTIYQERYMNTPQANPEGYYRGSPINFADGLKGNLLLIHGTGDDNVHYQNCEMLVNRLISHNKTFYQLSYPMRTHSISEGYGTSLHLRKMILDFFNKNL